MKSLCFTAPAVALLLPACSLLPPTAGTPPTARQQKISGELQSFADAIRHIEGADMDAQEAVAFFDTWTAGLDQTVPYVGDAVAALKLVYAAGTPTIAALEELATKYDS
jgi:hypothetical protein